MKWSTRNHLLCQKIHCFFKQNPSTSFAKAPPSDSSVLASFSRLQLMYHAAPAPYGGAVPRPTSRVELSLSAKNLKDRDVISKSDPFAVLSLLEGGYWVEIGRTEALKDNLSPTWTKLFLVDYYFELQQQLKVDVYDQDSSSKKLSEHDYIGGAAFTLGQLMGAPGQSGSFLLTRGKHSSTHRGSLLVKAEEAKNSAELARLRFSGQGLANMDGMFNKSDPFLVISRLREDNVTWTQVHKTEVIDNNLNPNWRTFELPMQQLCNGDHRRQLLFQVFDEDSTKSELIGEVHTCVEELMARRGTNFVLHNQKLQQKKGKKYTNAGLLVVHEVLITRMHSFLEYRTSCCLGVLRWCRWIVVAHRAMTHVPIVWSCASSKRRTGDESRGRHRLHGVEWHADGPAKLALHRSSWS